MDVEGRRDLTRDGLSLQCRRRMVWAGLNAGFVTFLFRAADGRRRVNAELSLALVATPKPPQTAIAAGAQS